MPLLESFIRTLQYYNVHDVLLPFILVFTVVYAVLAKSKVLGDDSKRFNVVLALVMALSVVIPHVLGLYGRRSVVDVINAALPQVSLVVVAIVMFMIMVGIFGKDIEFAGSTLSGWAVLLAIIAVFVIFGNAAGWLHLPRRFYFLEDPQVQSLITVILVFGLIIWFITHEPSDREDREVGKKMKKLSDFLG